MAFPKAFLYLEETASAKVKMAEAISLAQELNDFHGLAASLGFACYLSKFERSPGGFRRTGRMLVRLSTRFPHLDTIAKRLIRHWVALF
jgi:hypothetical protein